MKKISNLLLTFIITVLVGVIYVNAEESHTLPQKVNGKITLNKDVILDTKLDINEDTTLDLNGYTITANDKFDTIYVSYGANLIIVDSKGTGSVVNNSTGYAAIFNNGNTTIESGKFTKTSGEWYVLLNHGNMTINSGLV